MELGKDFWQIIEKVRKNRHLSIAKLCENIISERTYFRYLKSKKELQVDVFVQITKRLGLGTVEIVKHAFYFHKQDPGLTKFVFRLHNRYFKDIVPIYHSLIQYHDQNPDIDNLRQAVLSKYEYITNQITKDQYVAMLENLIYSTQSLNNTGIFILLVRILYYEICPNNNLYTAEDLTEQILHTDFRLGAIFYVIALDTLMYTIIGTDKVTLESFRKLTSRFEQFVELVDIKPLRMQKAFYQAYLHLIDSNYEEMENQLYLYATNSLVVFNGKAHAESVQKVKQLFNIDITSFVKQYAESIAIPKYFNYKDQR